MNKGFCLLAVLPLLLGMSGCVPKAETSGESAPIVSATVSPTPSPEPTPPPDAEPCTYEVRERVSADMPEYRFAASGAALGTEDWGMGFVLGLEVYDEQDAPILSKDFSYVLDGEVLGNHVYNQMMDTMGLHVVDVNFDGDRDVILLNSFSGVHSNTWYDCWLWDAETASFVPAPSFAEICNPALDAEHQRIYSAGGSGASYWGGRIYEFMDGAFVCTHELDTGLDGLVETALRDGEMEVVRQVSYGEDQAALEREQAYYRGSPLWQLDHPRWYWSGGHHADRWLE